MSILLVNGNAVSIPLADRSVHCIVTSPPYYGLRDYGTAQWEGGDPACDHSPRRKGQDLTKSTLGGSIETQNHQFEAYKSTTCPKCGAHRVDHQIGLEETPEAYISKMVEVFRECWRVLRDDGTLWLNMGDSYAGSGGPGSQYDNKHSAGLKGTFKKYDNPNRIVEGLKPKDLIGVPWMLAFALRADGWYLRSDIIWHKPNPMPESVTDRCTKSHEYIFLLSKSARYYYDAEAIAELSTDPEGSAARYEHEFRRKMVPEMKDGNKYSIAVEGTREFSGTRNKRSVWTVATAPYSGAHFATFPPALVEPCIKAGTSERGCCPKCGAPWERIIKASGGSIGHSWNDHSSDIVKGQRAENAAKGGNGYKRESIGWQPTCDCAAGAPVPCKVFDPFAGSGTTLQVARQLGRHAVGLDLSLRYLQECARTRLGLTAWEAWSRGIDAQGSIVSDLPLFGGAL